MEGSPDLVELLEGELPEIGQRCLNRPGSKRGSAIECVWRFERFARSVSRLPRAVKTFKALGSGFVSFSEQMENSTPCRQMVFTVLRAVAELERGLIKERVRAGITPSCSRQRQPRFHR
jgi:DNA invertase Pin-like site-specific DNA recombinase